MYRQILSKFLKDFSNKLLGGSDPQQFISLSGFMILSCEYTPFQNAESNRLSFPLHLKHSILLLFRNTFWPVLSIISYYLDSSFEVFSIICISHPYRFCVFIFTHLYINGKLNLSTEGSRITAGGLEYEKTSSI